MEEADVCDAGLRDGRGPSWFLLLVVYCMSAEVVKGHASDASWPFTEARPTGSALVDHPLRSGVGGRRLAEYGVVQ